MNRKNKELLNELIAIKLQKEAEFTKTNNKSSDDYDNLMKAIEKATKLKDIDDQSKHKYIALATGIIVTPMIDYGVKKVLAKMLCEFEKDYTFTTSAGKSLMGMFKFK